MTVGQSFRVLFEGIYPSPHSRQLYHSSPERLHHILLSTNSTQSLRPISPMLAPIPYLSESSNSQSKIPLIRLHKATSSCRCELLHVKTLVYSFSSQPHIHMQSSAKSGYHVKGIARSATWLVVVAKGPHAAISTSLDPGRRLRESSCENLHAPFSGTHPTRMCSALVVGR